MFSAFLQQVSIRAWFLPQNLVTTDKTIRKILTVQTCPASCSLHCFVASLSRQMTKPFHQKLRSAHQSFCCFKEKKIFDFNSLCRIHDYGELVFKKKKNNNLNSFVSVSLSSSCHIFKESGTMLE